MSFATLPPLDQQRVQRLAQHLVQLGPRAVAEALAEVAEHGELGRLDAYAGLTPAMLVVVSALDFPPRPLMAIPTAHDPEPLESRTADREVA